jgi:hypothetical protein
LENNSVDPVILSEIFRTLETKNNFIGHDFVKVPVIGEPTPPLATPPMEGI